MAAENLWNVDDVARYFKTGRSWVYKRTSPNTPFKPHIPRVKNLPQLRFDPEVIRAICPTASDTNSSLKSKIVGKSAFLETKTKIRQKEKLW